jgi:hypothetical protein
MNSNFFSFFFHQQVVKPETPPQAPAQQQHQQESSTFSSQLFVSQRAATVTSALVDLLQQQQQDTCDGRRDILFSVVTAVGSAWCRWWRERRRSPDKVREHGLVEQLLFSGYVDCGRYDAYRSRQLEPKECEGWGA